MKKLLGDQDRSNTRVQLLRVLRAPPSPSPNSRSSHNQSNEKLVGWPGSIYRQSWTHESVSCGLKLHFMNSKAAQSLYIGLQTNTTGWFLGSGQAALVLWFWSARYSTCLWYGSTVAGEAYARETPTQKQRKSGNAVGSEEDGRMSDHRRQGGPAPGRRWHRPS